MSSRTPRLVSDVLHHLFWKKIFRTKCHEFVNPSVFFYLFTLIFCFVPRGRLGWTLMMCILYFKQQTN